jgi:hypothetical protein
MQPGRPERLCSQDSTQYLHGGWHADADRRRRLFNRYWLAAVRVPSIRNIFAISLLGGESNWYSIFTLTICNYVCVLVINEAPNTIFETTARSQANRRTPHRISAGDASGPLERNMQDQARNQGNNCAIRYGSAF